MVDWKEYDQEELVGYIRNVADDEIVWDRVKKVDWVFNKRPNMKLTEEFTDNLSIVKDLNDQQDREEERPVARIV